MDFGLSEEQEMLKTMARDFLEKECPKAVVREMVDNEKGYPPQLWRQMAELGWMGLIVPEKHGGSGGSFLDLAVLLEEMGRALLPGPFFSTVVLGALPLMLAGTEAQKNELLPRIASGEIILTLALTEPGGQYDASGIEASAAHDGADYVVAGTKLFVPNAHVADYLICAVRTARGGSPEEGITLLLVEGKAASCTVLKTIDGSKLCEVLLEKVRVPAANLIGEEGKGWPLIEAILQRAAVAQCSEMVGGAQQVLDMTVAYAKDRQQFGRPIGSFQAVQHHCANMLMDVDGSRFITYQAAWMISEGIPCAREAAIAKAWVSEAYRRVTALGHQIHGGIGFCLDHDMPLYYKRAKALESTFGDADFHRETVAREIGM
ncbi:MAG: acyl-CoA/acyl-ACP dehydrogenase [Chloroflexi bacterium]|nr:acyl-CoA/acyl-ACP dehydrogenase [Chloroflexota bacterium]